MFVMGILGGISGGIYTRRRKKSSNAITMCVALLPLLVMSLENRFTPSPEIRTVETSIDIHASADTVWSNIERVPLIQPHELGFSWARSIGFPRPLEATLSHEGVGGIRHATFEHGVLFIETVDEWIPNQRLGFHIQADTANIPPKTFDEHVRIGGRYFDVLYGEYSLEPLPNGVIRLHLISRQRLSTDFDAYAGIWTDGVMRDLQQSILSVIQHRCERN
jgi:hypothetical protein